MGRDIAQTLSNMLRLPVMRSELAQIVGPYTVIGAQGHLFALSEPETYGSQFASPWRLASLPVLPEKFTLQPNLQRRSGKIIDSDLNKSIRTRLAQIKVLLKNADEVINCGDPDREGHLIISDILREFKFTGPVKRLWLHAQTPEGIEQAWHAMKDNALYANLELSALARRESDWAIGINNTRAYTILWHKKGHSGVLNIGRVVTPVVGMMVQREKDINNFKPTFHFGLKAQFGVGNDSFWALWQKPSGEPPVFDATGKLIVDKSFVQNVQTQCNGSTATITESLKTPKREGPPLLFSLTELQKMAAKIGYSPEDVLKAAQALYEKHKLTSYPRTECQYAPESEHKHSKKVLDAIVKNFTGAWSIPPKYNPAQKSRAWDDAKLAEHYAILPLATACDINTLTQLERDVYKLICRQYLVQFYGDYEYLNTTIFARAGEHTFKATGNVPVQLGWREIYGGAAKAKAGDDEAQENLPNVSKSDAARVLKTELLSKQTEPPKRFTAITLLEAMERAHQFVTDPRVKAALKEVSGLGTAATRANIIAKIVSSGFAVEQKTNVSGKGSKVITYVPTAKALTYIACVPERLATPDLTAWFEGKLDELLKGTLSYDRYREILAKLVHASLESALNGEAIGKIPNVQDMPAEQVTTKKAAAPRKKTFTRKSKA